VVKNIIEIYTDGSSRGNPGPGGWGVVLKSGKHYKELSGGFSCTTNNRMELYAVIMGLEAVKVKRAEITIYSDSSYVCDTINKGWLQRWMNKRFLNKKNEDLWMRFYNTYIKHRVTLVWIKGHAGHIENERCDQIAVEAALQQNLPEDLGYDATKSDSLFINS
jgi:Ribonuclease HI